MPIPPAEQRSGQAVELFTIQCTTCRARLKVNDESVIGDILACPKCGGMVQVVPPMGWQRASAGDAAPVALASETPRQVTAGDSAVAGPAPTPAKSQAAVVIPPALPSRPALPRTGAVAASKTPSAMVAPPQIPIAAPPQIPAQPPVPAASSAAPSNSIARPLSIGSAAMARIKQDWMLLSGGLAGGVLLGVAIWLAVASQTTTVRTVAENAPRAESAPVQPPAAAVPDVAGRAANEPSAPAPAEAPVAQFQPPTEAAAAEPPVQEAAPPATESGDHGKPSADPSPKPVVAPQGPTGPAIKLDPVPATGAQPAAASSDSPAAGATSAEDALAADNPMDVRPNRGGSSASKGNPPSAPRSLSQAQIEERLAGALPSVNFSKVPLSQFLEFIGDFTNLPITIDERALETLGKGRQTPVSVKLSDTTAGDALRTAVAKLGLTYAARDGKVVITVGKDQPAAK